MRSGIDGCTLSITKKFQRALLVGTLVERFIGGNGYLTDLGGVRLRVWLSVLCLAWVVLTFVMQPSTRIAKNVWAVLALFMGATLIGTLTGLGGGIDLKFILAELKGLLYFPMIMFFALAIRDREDVELVAKLLLGCAILQAVIFVGLMILIHAELLNFHSIYLSLKSDEFIFRHIPEHEFGLGFFFKGAFHLGIATLFLLFVPKFRNYALAALVIIALVFTETRGLWLAFGLAGIAGILILRKSAGYLALSIGALGAASLLLFTDAALLFGRADSDNVRLNDLKWIIENFDMRRIVTGYGMGAFIDERSRIEMTYLEIFFKQGLIGLLPWIAIYLVNLIAWLEIKGEDARLALVFHLSTLYVYLATATNTFLTGSIGMCIVLLSTVSLNVLRQHLRCASATGATHA